MGRPKGVFKEGSDLDIAAKSGFTKRAVQLKRRAGFTAAEIIEQGKLREKRRAETPETEAFESEDEPCSPSETFAQATLREKIAVANKREMEELQMRGELVSADEVAGAWGDAAARIRDEMLSIPDRISLKLDGRPYREIREAMMTEIRKTLALLSEEIASKAA